MKRQKYERQSYREDSDWDVLVTTEKEANPRLKRRIRDEIFDVELEFTQAISTLYSKGVNGTRCQEHLYMKM